MGRPIAFRRIVSPPSTVPAPRSAYVCMARPICRRIIIPEIERYDGWVIGYTDEGKLHVKCPQHVDTRTMRLVGLPNSAAIHEYFDYWKAVDRERMKIEDAYATPYPADPFDLIQRRKGLPRPKRLKGKRRQIT